MCIYMYTHTHTRINRYALGGFAAGAGVTWWGVRKMAPTISWRYASIYKCVCVCVSE